MTRTVLIVENNSIERESLSAMLNNTYEIIFVKNRKEVTSALHKKGRIISAILLDLATAETDNFEILQEIRGNSVYGQIPVVAVTERDDEKSHLRAMSLGANVCVFKPVNKELLNCTLENSINLREKSVLANAFRKDSLTGLPNGISFFETAEAMIFREKAGYYVIASIDIDNFKVINDQYGFSGGNEVLKNVAQAVEQAASSLGGICCRYSADKFGILYPAEYKDSKTITRLHEKLAGAGHNSPVVKIRIGRYLVDDLTVPVNAMYDRATLAEESIRGRYDVFIAEYADSMRTQLLNEQKIINDMDEALINGEFEPWLQPQYNHATGALIGAEALVRWKKDGAYISPIEFVPVFERNGFIYEMDQYIWEQVCMLLRKWLNQGQEPLPISVNVSRRDLFHEDFIDTLVSIVKKYDIPYHLLRIEVTESAFAEAAKKIIDKVGQLIRMGFIVEIDDFGSAYSSLNTLKDVPASILKLDMKFFENTENSQRGGNIIESVVRMSKWLGMAVIAEGVEDKEQADYLKSIGCYYIQGFYYAKPMPVSEYEKLLAESAKEPELTRLKTLKTLDNSEFWNPKSMETLIFNSYVGGACIFEYSNGKTELLRINEQYIGELGGLLAKGAKLEDSSVVRFLDEKNKEKVISILETAIRTEKEASCEVGLTDKAHAEFVRVTVRLIARADECYLFYCVILNVTQQREAERKQAESAQRLKIIMSNVNGGVSAIQIDDDGTSKFIFCNDKYYELYGYTREEAEAVNLDVMSTIVPEDFPDVIAKVKKLKQDRKPQIIDYRCRKRDGKLVYLRVNASLMDMEGYGDVITSVVTDITAEKEASEQLKFLNESAHDILAQPDSNVAVNNTIEKLMAYFGGDRAYVVEMDYERKVSDNTYEICAEGVTSQIDSLQNIPLDVSKHWFDLLGSDRFVVHSDVDSLDDSDAELRELLLRQGINSIILAPMWRDGVLMGFVGIDNPKKAGGQLNNLKALADYIAILLTSRDLSAKIHNDRKMMSALMDDAPGGFVRMKREELLDNLPCGAALYEYDGKNLSVIHINKSYWELVNRQPDNYSEISVFAVIHPEDREIAHQEIDAAIGQNRNAKVNLRILCGQSEYKPFRIEAKITPAKDGKHLLFAAYTPISDQTMSVQEMIPIALSTMMSASEDISYLIDRDLRYICCSQSVANMLGLKSQRDMIGKTAHDFFDKAFADKFSEDDRNVILSGEPLIDSAENIPSKDGGIRLASTSKYPILDPSGNVMGVYCVSRDITSQREKESQLELLTGSIPGGIAAYSITDEGVHMSYFNDGYYKFSGYSREEYGRLVEEDPLAVVFEEDKPKIRDMIKGFVNNKIDGHVNGCIYRCHTMDGGYRWMSMKTVLSKLGDDRFIANVIQFDITEQQEEKERLRMSEEFNRIAIEQSGNIITRFDVQNRTLTLPDSFNPIFVLPHVLNNMPEEQISLGRVSPDTAHIYRELFESIVRGQSSGSATYKQNSTKGWRWMEAQFTTVFSNDGKPRSAVISFTDVTEELEKEVVYNKWQQSLNERPEDSYTLFRYNLSKGASIDSWEGELLKVSPEDAKKTFAQRTSEYVKKMVYKEDRGKYITFVNSNTMLAEYYRGHRTDMLEYREVNDDGSTRWLRLTVDLVEYPNSKDIEAYLMYEDIDRRKKEDLLVLERSETDPLTGILNRSAFIEKMEEILMGSKEGEKHALLMMDIDNFKGINDTLGHGVGDQVLRGLTSKIGSILRQGDLIGRLGGDEFFVLLKNIPGDEAAAAKAERICRLNIPIGDSKSFVTVSVGIAMVPRDGSDFDELYKKVDHALYRQKENGKNGFLFV